MTLTVVMLDTFRTRLAIIHENEHIPYGRRTVQIQLTPEQIDKLKPRKLGHESGREVYEEFGGVWFEPRAYV